MPTPFKEDFFERVIDVKWEVEPEVYWMAATGFPLITNGGVLFDHAWVYFSEDGKHWQGQDVWAHDAQGFSAFYTGGWLREGLQSGNHPVWAVQGCSSKGVVDAAAGYSDDGQTFNIKDRTVFDTRHHCEGFNQNGPTTVHVMSASNFSSFDFHFHVSPNGREWTPQKYHGGEEGEALLTTTATPLIRSPVARVTVDNPRAYYEKEFHNRTPLLLPKPKKLLTPFAEEGGSGLDKAADDIVLTVSDIRTVGKCNKGQFKGKFLQVEIKPYHNFPEGGDHGDSTVEITVLNPDGSPVKGKEGPLIFTADVGMERSIVVSYGHYVFVVGGSSKPASVDQGKNQMTSISWSENGTDWKKVDLGFTGQINVMPVGPRPKKQ